MKLRFDFRALFSVAAIAIGLIVLCGYFLDMGVLVILRRIFLQWALILMAVAMVVGVINLFQVHMRRVFNGEKGGTYSLVLVLSMAVTISVAGFWGPTSSIALWIFNNIQVPIESSLMAVLAVILAYASARLLYRRLTIFSLIFVGTVLIALLGTISLPGINLPELVWVRDWLARVPAVAGARGILFGVALGTVATGLRVLMGADRPYGG